MNPLLFKPCDDRHAVSVIRSRIGLEAPAWPSIAKGQSVRSGAGVAGAENVHCVLVDEASS
jgi:thymidine kinase